VFDVIHLPVDAARRPQPATSRILVDNRHGGRINLLFLDGHVENRQYVDVSRRDFDFLYNL
jgi:prepilin-type processing-associated H-X9-DG protein